MPNQATDLNPEWRGARRAHAERLWLVLTHATTATRPSRWFDHYASNTRVPCDSATEAASCDEAELSTNSNLDGESRFLVTHNDARPFFPSTYVIRDSCSESICCGFAIGAQMCIRKSAQLAHSEAFGMETKYLERLAAAELAGDAGPHRVVLLGTDRPVDGVLS